MAGIATPTGPPLSSSSTNPFSSSGLRPPSAATENPPRKTSPRCSQVRQRPLRRLRFRPSSDPPLPRQRSAARLTQHPPHGLVGNPHRSHPLAECWRNATIFWTRFDETRAMARHYTMGIELRVSCEQLILVDTQPIFHVCLPSLLHTRLLRLAAADAMPSNVVPCAP